MNKETKIKIVNDIITKIIAINYEFKDELLSCKDEINSFIRNILGDNSIWTARINQISYFNYHYKALTITDKITKWNSGKAEFVNVLKSIINEITLYDKDNFDSIRKLKTKKIFIVHGQNDTIKVTVARIIEKLGLIPIILHEQPELGRTIIEKFEMLSEDISFAIVILSADDKISNKSYRARQNVIFELGYFTSQLGRNNLAVLYDKSDKDKVIEIPSDITGVLYLPYDSPDGSWRLKLVKELQTAGFSVGANDLF
ncbi:MAG: nucleotide-binding protein [Deltaproteobacteria bacterium]|nr:nucleotide-binding protein [Deltaproteobacteria bacterium]